MAPRKTGGNVATGARKIDNKSNNKKDDRKNFKRDEKDKSEGDRTDVEIEEKKIRKLRK